VADAFDEILSGSMVEETKRAFPWRCDARRRNFIDADTDRVQQRCHEGKRETPRVSTALTASA
jgi:hypothetical protein